MNQLTHDHSNTRRSQLKSSKISTVLMIVVAFGVSVISLVCVGDPPDPTTTPTFVTTSTSNQPQNHPVVDLCDAMDGKDVVSIANSGVVTEQTDAFLEGFNNKRYSEEDQDRFERQLYALKAATAHLAFALGNPYPSNYSGSVRFTNPDDAAAGYEERLQLLETQCEFWYGIDISISRSVEGR